MSSALFSPSGGILVPLDDDPPRAHLLFQNIECGHDETLRLARWYDDWREVPLPSSTKQQDLLLQESCSARAYALTIDVLVGLPHGLTNEVLVELDELLSTYASVDEVIAKLCISPLDDPTRVRRLLTFASEKHLNSAAQLFRRTDDLQPLLHRLADAWLSFPESMFLDVGLTRFELWGELSRSAVIPDVAQATSYGALQAVWLEGVMQPSPPAMRAGLYRVGRELAARFFPSAAAEFRSNVDELLAESDEAREHSHRPMALSTADKIDRALKQVEAIAETVARGQDHKAELFLKELVASQIDDDHEYVVKSLCNIAQRCADLFRTDFERQCLLAALELQPSDPWLLTQWGDYLKRTRQYEEALSALDRARSSGSIVAHCAFADVLREKGEYDEAEAVYRSIPNWEDDLTVRTAIADLERFRGNYSEADALYEKIIVSWGPRHRALSGRAEVLKAHAHFDEAIAIFDEVLARPDVDARDRWIYQYSKSDALALSGKVHTALEQLDSLLLEAPFMMNARFKRAALLGALDRADEGVWALSGRVADPLQSWRGAYIRGLLLMKLSRFDEAAELLEPPSASEYRDIQSARTQLFVGLAAVHGCLNTARLDAPMAADRLTRIPQGFDAYSSLLRDVVVLHVAARNRERGELSKLSRSIKKRATEVHGVIETVKTIRRGDFAQAWQLQTNLLLRAA